MNLLAHLRLIAALIVVSCASMASTARAEEGPAELCLSAHENVQLARASGDLSAARAALQVCIKAECPPIVRNDCVIWYSEVSSEQPSLVVTASEGDHDVDDGQVFVDDVLHESALDGKPLLLNPGRHVVRLVRPGRAAVEKVVVLTLGETGRRIQFDLSSPTSPSGATASAPPSAPPPTEYERPIPAVSYWLAGASAVALLAGATFGVVGLIEKNGLDCAPYCSTDQKSSVDTKFVIADIGYGVGVAAGVAAVITYLVRPSVPTHSGATTQGWTATVAPELGYVGYRGVF